MAAALVALAIDVHLAQAAPVEAAEPPASNMTGEDYARLMARRKSLDESRYALEQDLAALNSDCSRVPASDTGRVAHCRSRQQALLARIRAYKDALAAYRQDVAAAQRRAADFERLDQEIRADNGRRMSPLHRLMIEADNIFVPPPPGERRVHEGVLLGLFDDDRDVMGLLNGVVSPFSGRRYAAGEVRPTTDAATAHRPSAGCSTTTIWAPTRSLANTDAASWRTSAARITGACSRTATGHDRRGPDPARRDPGGRARCPGRRPQHGERQGVAELIDSGRVKRVVV
jgi:hypothetical protein